LFSVPGKTTIIFIGKTMRFPSKAVAGLVIVLFLVPGLRARTVSVAGEWELIAKAKHGSLTWKVVFEQDGGTLSVTMTGPKGAEIKGTGTLTEDQIEWGVQVPTPRGEVAVAYSGLVRGDEMAGEVKRGNTGTSEWTARRKGS
jgi:hypothetical protein